ncbi:MAG: hypothetical protein P8Y45_11285 [Exilibacterium sp.]
MTQTVGSMVANAKPTGVKQPLPKHCFAAPPNARNLWLRAGPRRGTYRRVWANYLDDRRIEGINTPDY